MRWDDSRRRSYELTPEGLTRLRASIQRKQPWLRSTGPRSVQGKEQSSMNALRHGIRSARVVAVQRELNKLLRVIGI